jgi:hypothetical protein
MPNFSSEIPANPKAFGFDLRRTPEAKPVNAVITSEDLIGCYTHYWKQHTLPCEAPECPACADNIPSRWHGYVACFDPRNHDQFLFEFTLKAAENFKKYRDTYGTLRGCAFLAFRPKRTKNARVTIQCKPTDLTKLFLPDPPDLIKALGVIWQIKPTAFAPTTAIDSHPTLEADPAALDTTYGRSPNRNGNRFAHQQGVL